MKIGKIIKRTEDTVYIGYNNGSFQKSAVENCEFEPKIGDIVHIYEDLVVKLEAKNADHVVSGTVLNLMAPALAVFLVKVLYNKGQTDNLSQTFGRFDFPVLANIPFIGDIFFK